MRGGDENVLEADRRQLPHTVYVLDGPELFTAKKVNLGNVNFTTIIIKKKPNNPQSSHWGARVEILVPAHFSTGFWPFSAGTGPTA